MEIMLMEPREENRAELQKNTNIHSSLEMRKIEINFLTEDTESNVLWSFTGYGNIEGEDEI